MRKNPKTVTIGDMFYWSSGDDLGKCRICDDRAFSYNENGDLYCETHLIEWHESEEFEDDQDGDCRGVHCGVIGCPSCDREYYENYSECSKLPNGQCLKAGSEECDFECPYR